MAINVKGLKILIIGTGISGRAAARLMCGRSASVILFDSRNDIDKEAVLKEFSAMDDIRIYTGELPPTVARAVDFVVLSPGVPYDSPFVMPFRNRQLSVMGEVELAYSFSKGDLLAITGTNGKTTTTTLVGDIVRNWHIRKKGNADSVYVVGNIGNPYSEAAMKADENSVFVAELSSFQLETIETLRPNVASILNITPDHMDRHHTMENYINAKARILENMRETDTMVLNYDDDTVRSLRNRSRARAVFFTRDPDYRRQERDTDFLHMDKDVIYYNDESILNVHDMKLLGTHNYENVMAAIGMSVSYGVPMDIILDTVINFNAVEHRIEFVKTVDGVDYYNDSKGTNPDAAAKAVLAMEKRVCLIAGGYDKDLPFDELVETFEGRVELLILFGETADKIEKCALKHGFEKTERAGDLKEAVKLAHERMSPGSAVLLSPACASWDMFRNYEERGRIFKELVNEL